MPSDVSIYMTDKLHDMYKMQLNISSVDRHVNSHIMQVLYYMMNGSATNVHYYILLLITAMWLEDRWLHDI